MNSCVCSPWLTKSSSAWIWVADTGTDVYRFCLWILRPPLQLTHAFGHMLVSLLGTLAFAHCISRSNSDHYSFYSVSWSRFPRPLKSWHSDLKAASSARPSRNGQYWIDVYPFKVLAKMPQMHLGNAWIATTTIRTGAGCSLKPTENARRHG